MIQKEQGTPHFILDKIISLPSVSALENRLISPCIADFLFCTTFLYQLSPVKQKTNDFSILFCFITQTLAVIPIHLLQFFCYSICFFRNDAHLTVCNIIVVLLPIPFSLFLQQVSLSVIKVPERVRSSLKTGELILYIVIINFRTLRSFLFQAVSCQIISISLLFPVLHRTAKAVHTVVCIFVLVSFTALLDTVAIPVISIVKIQQHLPLSGQRYQTGQFPVLPMAVFRLHTVSISEFSDLSGSGVIIFCQHIFLVSRHPFQAVQHIIRIVYNISRTVSKTAQVTAGLSSVISWFFSL